MEAAGEAVRPRTRPSAERGFPPIADYAIIGDCRTAALISSAGSVEWLCLPDFHSPSLFARILDREKGGYLKVAPTGGGAASRRYLDGTNILETVFETPEGRLRVTDFMAIAPPENTDLQPERELLRIVDALDGEPEVEVVFAPRPDYGRTDVTLKQRGRLGWVIEGTGTFYLLRSDIGVEHARAGTLMGRRRLAKGERARVSLSYASRDPGVIPGLDGEADRKLEDSRGWWRDWSAECSYDGPYAAAVLRSVLALKLLQFVTSGAVIAAPTTSLPEAIGAGRNWDYRYCWLRDAAFTLLAFTDTGFSSEAAAFFGWLMHATRITQPKLQVLYDVYGRTELAERELGHLSGYCRSRPVRIGNAAHEQLQLDIYGAVTRAAAEFVLRGQELGPTERGVLASFGKVVCDLWREPDNGIWEFRHGRMHNVWSKVMCWSTLNDLLALDAAGVIRVPRERFASERAAIQQAITDHGMDRQSGGFTGAFDDGFADATLLLLPRYGFVDARDPRMTRTWERTRDRLESGGLIRRYESGTDRFSGEEGAFVICSLWAVDYLARAGRLEEARERFESILGRANDVGLFAEEIDPARDGFLGNFPQSFSHSGIINAALAIEAASQARRNGQ